MSAEPVTNEPVTAVSRANPARTRLRWSIAVLSVLAFALTCANILLGSFTITVPDFFAILFGEQIQGASFIVMEVKLPRTLLGIAVGCAFALGGTIFQELLRNPLASPDIIGVSAGASASAVIGIVFFSLSGWQLSLVALAGAAFFTTTVLLLAGRDNGNRFILMGIGLAAFAVAVIIFVMERAEYTVARDAVFWLAGSLSMASWNRLLWMCVSLAVALPLLVFIHNRLKVMSLGDELATSLGVQARPTRGVMLMLAVMLIAAGTAAAGPISFLAFLSGPIAKFILRGRTNLIVSALVGVVIILAADYIGNYLLGASLPVGVITGVCGAPFLLWLLATANKKASS